MRTITHAGSHDPGHPHKKPRRRVHTGGVWKRPKDRAYFWMAAMNSSALQMSAR